MSDTRRAHEEWQKHDERWLVRSDRLRRAAWAVAAGAGTIMVLSRIFITDDATWNTYTTAVLLPFVFLRAVMD